ncbi:ABC transporter substrate-binding protein [Alginatibacterium sediminis]|uniref:ABC transporter substrate-binding protein n=1 Tax=Alginatibacterium sediminis TaxID=2164068 RepID=A0A420ECW7_9ALTE|nr:ABC transporter substrate-binding protein [Alginatibacterium sediminis]RKF18579.1 ABC transporter substrate-binding protein [Alginatibacterium sediminis]
MKSFARPLFRLLCYFALANQALAKDIVVGLSNPDLETDFVKQIERNALFFNSLVFDPLFRVLDEEFTQPLLVESWRQVKPGLLELRLKANVKHHSGNPFQAKDVVWTFEQLSKQGGSPVFLGIDKIEATSERHIRVWTQLNPRIAFRRLAFLYPADSEHAKSSKEDRTELPVSGTGAFRLVEHQANVMTVLERNQDYWRPTTGNIDKVTLIPIQSVQARFGALYTGDVDLIDNLDAESMVSIKQEPNINPLPIDSHVGVGLQLNHNHPLLKQLAVRQALNQAIDRKDLVGGLFGEFGREADQMSLPQSPRYNTELKVSYNPEAALELLENIEGDRGQKLIMLAPRDLFLFDYEIAQRVYRSFERLNLNIELRFLTAQQYIYQRHICQADIVLTSITADNVSSLEAMAKEYSESRANSELGQCHFYPDIDIDQSLQDGLEANNFAQVVTSFRSIERKLAEDVAFIPILWNRPIWAVRGQVEQHENLGGLPFPNLSSLQILDPE